MKDANHSPGHIKKDTRGSQTPSRALNLPILVNARSFKRPGDLRATISLDVDVKLIDKYNLLRVYMRVLYVSRGWIYCDRRISTAHTHTHMREFVFT